MITKRTGTVVPNCGVCLRRRAHVSVPDGLLLLDKLYGLTVVSLVQYYSSSFRGRRTAQVWNLEGGTDDNHAGVRWCSSR